jgi:hypothetical protein
MSKAAPIPVPGSGSKKPGKNLSSGTFLEKEVREKQTLAQCKRIIEYVGGRKERFARLVKLFFQGDDRLTQHAAWPISYCVRLHPSLAKPYFKKFIDLLSDPQAARAAKRNIVRLLQFVEVPPRYQGKLMSICFQLISDPKEAIAVKAFSLTILERLGEVYPEILPELKTVIESRWAFETAAFRSRGRKILEKMNKGEAFRF